MEIISVGPKLSICITTLNRATVIGETLESILTQVPPNDCEVVVLDGASTDRTEEVLTDYTRRFHCLRYIKQSTNNGLDRDYDGVVEIARGEYCWLMTDDDLLIPGAVASILEALREDPSLVIANVESRDRDMSKSKSIQGRWLNIKENREYGPGEMDRLVIDVGQALRYIGCFVIKREVWRSRDRGRHYGTFYNYLSVIFQEPLPSKAIVIAEPLILFRWGNTHAWTQKLFEIRMVHLPNVVRSLCISDSAKRTLSSGEPWRNGQDLLHLRALGYYSLAECRKWIYPKVRSRSEALTPTLVAILPGVLVNACFVFYYSITRRLYRGVWEPEVVLQVMRQSRFYLFNCRIFRRAQ